MNRRIFVLVITLLVAVLSVTGCDSVTIPGHSLAMASAAATPTIVPLATEAVTADGEPVLSKASPERSQRVEGNLTDVAPTPTLLKAPTATPQQAQDTALVPSDPTVALSSPEVSAPPSPAPLPDSEGPAERESELTGKLVFQTSNGGDIYVINADGTGLRRLTDGMEPAWSPDGTKVAFARWRDPRGIYVINEDGSNETLVFGWVAAKGPAWSPDGSRIAFTRWYGGREEDTEVCFWRFCQTLPADQWWKLGVVRLEDGYFQDLRCYPHSLSPTWSPDGSVIAYDSDFGIHLTNEEGTIGDVTHDRSLFAISTDGRDISPVWSPLRQAQDTADGPKIAFGFRQHDHWEIYVMNADGSNRVRLTKEEPFTPRPPNNVSPAWSPDGRHIAFFTDRNGELEGEKWELYVMDADGSNQRPMFETALDDLPIEYGFVAERMVSWTK